MPLGLKRYQHEGDDHFITFGCYRREPYFTTTASKDIFLKKGEADRLPPKTTKITEAAEPSALQPAWPRYPPAP